MAPKQQRIPDGAFWLSEVRLFCSGSIKHLNTELAAPCQLAADSALAQ